MNYIKSKWRTITFITLILCYILFIFIMDKRVDYLYTAGMVYMVITFLLFLGTIVGIPGIILHSVFKKENHAMPFYKLAINLGSNNTNILAAYGLILLKNFHPDEALEVFEKAKDSTKHFLYHKTLSANIALCKWKSGDTKEAAKTYEDLFYYPDLEVIEDFSLENLDEGISKNHNFFAQDYTTMAYLLFADGQTEKALYFTKVALDKLANYGPAFDNLGQIEYQKGNMDEAIGFFNEGLKHKPGMVDSLYYLARIYIEKNDEEQAKKYLNQINKSKINGLSTVTLKDISELEKRVS